LFCFVFCGYRQGLYVVSSVHRTSSQKSCCSFLLVRTSVRTVKDFFVDRICTNFRPYAFYSPPRKMLRVRQNQRHAPVGGYVEKVWQLKYLTEGRNLRTSVFYQVIDVGVVLKSERDESKLKIFECLLLLKVRLNSGATDCSSCSCPCYQQYRTSRKEDIALSLSANGGKL
jgi:hypothetical protein